jgi:hypothetical protein
MATPWFIGDRLVRVMVSIDYIEAFGGPIPNHIIVRSPCPMLNTLANYGLLPHDGKNITEEQTANALKLSINLNEDVAKSQFQEALATNPTPGATTFSLDDLSRHNIIEHDASLRYVNQSVLR